MKTIIHGNKTETTVNKVLVFCGIIAAFLYVITDLIAVYRWKEYSMSAQAFSELIATDAPTRAFMVPLLVLYCLLVYAFGVGIMRVGKGVRSLQWAGVFIITKEILGLIITLFFPIHLRGVETNYQDTWHGILTAAGVLSLLLGIGFSAVNNGKWFRYYSIITIVLMTIFGIWAGTDAPNIEANLPTPLFGLKERINIYGYMLWMCVMSVMMLEVTANVTKMRGEVVKR